MWASHSDIQCVPILRWALASTHMNMPGSGELYTFGFNSRGQLGHGSTTSISTPTKLEDLASHHVVEVACSYFHTVVMTLEGNLYAFGRNDLGQLGIDDGMDRHVPVPLSYFNCRPVLAVACGQHHTVVSLASGGVVAFGKNDHGQLGTGDTSDYHTSPSLLAAPLDSLIVPSLACGYYHTAALAENGLIYSFGRNDYGQLGHGHRQHLSEPTVLLMHSLVDPDQLNYISILVMIIADKCTG